MSKNDKTEIGTIVWTDLTVQDAQVVQHFYSEVVGWQSSPHDMGGYHDFNMSTAQRAQAVAGICHARGDNANLPPQWLIYITVADVSSSAERCQALGGEVLDGPSNMGRHRFCVIRDPAGAVAALIEQ